MAKITIYRPYITKNGRRIKPIHAKFFKFEVDVVKHTDIK